MRGRGDEGEGWGLKISLAIRTVDIHTTCSVKNMGTCVCKCFQLRSTITHVYRGKPC